MFDTEYKEVKPLTEQTWLVRRYGKIEEVVEWDDSIKYRVIVSDVGRQPFINKKFASRQSAENFYDKIKEETAIALEDRHG